MHLRCVAIALAACAGVPAVAPPLTRIDPAAQPLVDAWARALGGRDRVRAVGALHLRGKLGKGGLAGTIDLWATPRGELREDRQLAFLHEVEVFDGAHGWLSDRNAEVRDLAGFEIDDALAVGYFWAGAAIAPERLAGTVTVAPTGGLVLAPAGGARPVTVTFDPTTHLPRTLSRRDHEKLRTTALGDWRAVDGVMIPFSIREDNGTPGDAEAIEVTFAAHGSSPAFARPPDRAPDATVDGGITDVPIELVADALVFVHATIDGQPMEMVLDTGAEATVLSASRLAKLGLASTGEFATGAGGGDVGVSYVPHVTTAVGGATVRDQIVGVIDLDALERPLGRPLDGILGYDFVSRFVVELDYAGKRLRLRDRAYQHAGTPIAISLADSTPALAAAVELPGRPPVPGSFVLDTGCTCEVELSTPFTDQHDLLSAVPDARSAGFSAGAGGETHQLSARIAALHLGSVTIEHPIADFARDQVGASTDPESAGLIGGLVWRRFVLVLDYHRRAIWLDPISRAGSSGAGSD